MTVERPEDAAIGQQVVGSPSVPETFDQGRIRAQAEALAPGLRDAQKMVIEKFQVWLNEIENMVSWKAAEKKNAPTTVNQMAEKFGIRLLYGGSSCSMRYSNGSFQGWSPGGHNLLYQGTEWPHLDAVPRSLPQTPLCQPTN